MTGVGTYDRGRSLKFSIDWPGGQWRYLSRWLDRWFVGVFSQGWNIRRGDVFQGRYKALGANGEGSGEYFQ